MVFHDGVDGVDSKKFIAWQVCVFYLMPTVCDGWSIEGKHTRNDPFNAHLLLLWCSELLACLACGSLLLLHTLCLTLYRLGISFASWFMGFVDS